MLNLDEAYNIFLDTLSAWEEAKRELIRATVPRHAQAESLNRLTERIHVKREKFEKAIGVR